MKTLLPAIYLANHQQMIKEANPFLTIGRMLGRGVNAGGAAVNAGIRGADATIAGVNRMGNAAVRGAQALPGAISRIPGQIAGGAGAAGGALRHGFKAHVAGPIRNAGLNLNAGLRELTGKPLSFQQQNLVNAHNKARAAYQATPWMNRSVGFNSNGAAALAGTAGIGAGANAWINHQTGGDWRQQMAGMTPNFQMPDMQSPVQFRSPFKTASWTAHWCKPASFATMAGASGKGFRAAADAVGAATRAAAPAASKTAPAISSAADGAAGSAWNWMKSLHPKAQEGMEWLGKTGPGQWAQKNPGMAGFAGGMAMMRGGEYARNTVRENRIANMSPMERLMMAGGLVFNPQGVASRLY